MTDDELLEAAAAVLAPPWFETPMLDHYAAAQAVLDAVVPMIRKRTEDEIVNLVEMLGRSHIGTANANLLIRAIRDSGAYREDRT